jgi:dTDP-4-dehydrorhamnose reductase
VQSAPKYEIHQNLFSVKQLHHAMSSTSASEVAKVIVLTGASGFLGQHFLLRVLEDRQSVASTTSNELIVYALHQSSSELNDAVSSYFSEKWPTIMEKTQVVVMSLDLTSLDECSSWFSSLMSSGIAIDCCVHTAAMSVPAVCEKDPGKAFAINVPRNFLNGLYANNPMIKIIALSTDQVYDGNSPEPYNEESSCEPSNIYGKTKVDLENYLMQQQILFPKSTAYVLRSSIMLGPLAPFLPGKAHSTFLHFCHSRIHSETTYFTDEIRSVLAVSDVVSVLIHFVSKSDKCCSSIYCMGGPFAVNRQDMALAVLSYFHQPTDVAIPVKKADFPLVPGSAISPLNISMDSRKLLATTDISNLKSLSDMVAQTFASYDTSN